mmetsp:Transcript_2698/g.5107  ORF Transcript_2698/g.5107 Transcript_2698/m.5107 type:complete len:237 (+) Transcript_2698:39-749(+)
MEKRCLSSPAVIIFTLVVLCFDVMVCSHSISSRRLLQGIARAHELVISNGNTMNHDSDVPSVQQPANANDNNNSSQSKLDQFNEDLSQLNSDINGLKLFNNDSWIAVLQDNDIDNGTQTNHGRNRANQSVVIITNQNLQRTFHEYELEAYRHWIRVGVASFVALNCVTLLMVIAFVIWRNQRKKTPKKPTLYDMVMKRRQKIIAKQGSETSDGYDETSSDEFDEYEKCEKYNQCDA